MGACLLEWIIAWLLLMGVCGVLVVRRVGAVVGADLECVFWADLGGGGGVFYARFGAFGDIFCAYFGALRVFRGVFCALNGAERG